MVVDVYIDELPDNVSIPYTRLSKFRGWHWAPGRGYLLVNEQAEATH